MNGFIIEISPIKDYEFINNDYGKEIYKSLLKILEMSSEYYNSLSQKIKVSNIFGMFYDKSIKLVKDKKYKIRIITKENEIFQKMTQMLFNIVLNKKNIKLGEIEYKLTSIITSDKTWCGEYDFEEEYEKININENFYKKMNLKIVTPVLKNEKSIFEFEDILKIILNQMDNEHFFNKNFLEYEENILKSIIIKNEIYKIKYLKNEKIYLGDIEVELQGYYGKLLYTILNYIKFTGVGEQKEYGYGEIIVEESGSVNKKKLNRKSK